MVCDATPYVVLDSRENSSVINEKLCPPTVMCLGFVSVKATTSSSVAEQKRQSTVKTVVGSGTAEVGSGGRRSTEITGCLER